MLRLRRHLPTIVAAVVFVVVNAAVLRWSATYWHRADGGVRVKYGDRLPRVKGPTLVGDSVVELPANRANLVLYVSSYSQRQNPSFELLKYAEILARSYGPQGLNVTAVVDGDIPDLKDLLRHSVITYDVITDAGRQIASRLGVDEHHNGVFLFDERGVCRFSTTKPISAEDVRQLVAMDFLHRDPLKDVAAGGQVLKEGRPLGSWQMIDVRSWEQTSLEKVRQGANLFVFFTAECSVCSLPDYLDKFAEFERTRPRLEQETGTVLVFDFNFPPGAVLEQLESHHISSPAYISNEPLVSVAELKEVEAGVGRVVAVRTDGGGVIQQVSSLRSLGTPEGGSVVKASAPASPLPDEARFEEMFTGIALSAYDVAGHDGRYFITDATGNRLLVVNDRMEVEREIGRMGAGPGRFFHPGGVRVARDGTIYVQDGGNSRVERFAPDGSYLGEFHVERFEGFAIGARKEIYVGQPEEGHLITVYSETGEKLRSFGQLKKYSEAFGAQFADKDEPYKIALNRVRLSTDAEGNIYVSFSLIPFIRKYSPDGRLLFERRLEAPEVDSLLVEIHQRKYISTVKDGVDARILALDPVVEPSSGNIFVPLVDGTVYVADRDGQRLAVLHPRWTRRAGQSFYPFTAALGARGEVLVNPFPPERFYRLIVPPGVLERQVADLGPQAKGND